MQDRQAVIEGVEEAVNMSAPASWSAGCAATPPARSAGPMRAGTSRSATIRAAASSRCGGKDHADSDDEDLAHMRKVVGVVHRHLAKRPDGDVRDTRWRHSLTNRGHDPLRTAAAVQAGPSLARRPAPGEAGGRSARRATRRG